MVAINNVNRLAENSSYIFIYAAVFTPKCYSRSRRVCSEAALKSPTRSVFTLVLDKRAHVRLSVHASPLVIKQ